MEVVAKALGKRFAYTWIIKALNIHIQANDVLGISGANGSGKSTLLKMLSGYLTPSIGDISYYYGGKSVHTNQLYTLLSWVAPYTNLIQEYTMEEMFYFHFKFKQPRIDLPFSKFKDIVQLTNQKAKPIQFYSSGMNQRLQLALAILSDTPLLILDEPTSYLDEKAKDWMMNLLDEHKSNRTIIIASNDADDFRYCKDKIYL